jgi:hypothetical protein
MAVVRQWLGKYIPVTTGTHNSRRTVGCGVFSVIYAEGNPQY